MNLPKDPKVAIDFLKAFLNDSTVRQTEAIVTPVTQRLRSDLKLLASSRSTDAEAIARARVAGVTTTILDTDSYKVEGPAGTLLFEGSGVADENFMIDPLGRINVSKAWRMIEASAPANALLFPIDTGLLSQLPAIDIDPAKVSSLSHHARRLPLLFVREARGLFLVDGAHRLLARAIDGRPSVHGFVLTEKHMTYLQVRVWRIDNTGRCTEVDTTKGWVALHPAERAVG